MINIIEKYISPSKNQEFLWFADYCDNTNITEMDDNLKEYSFNSIDKNKVAKFGLFGRRKRYLYDTSTGIFNILGNKYSFILKSGDKECSLTVPSKDIITYKMGCTNFNPINGKSFNYIQAYYFGYKNLIIYKDNTNIYVKFIYCMSGIDPSAKALLYRVVSDKDISNAQIILKVNNGVNSVVYNEDIKAEVAAEGEIVI